MSENRQKDTLREKSFQLAVRIVKLNRFLIEERK
jgi:hypothetical protein